MCTNEQLALLYQETQDKKSREKIFTKVFKDVERMAYDICLFHKNSLNKLANQEDFFEDAMQEARLVLVKCIESFDATKNTLLSTYYGTCLKNHIANMVVGVKKIGINEFVDSTVFNWINKTTDEDVVEKIDNQILYKILNKHIDGLSYSKPIHKQIFKDYFGLTDKSKKESFGSLAQRYILSRMAVKKIIDKYFALLKRSLEKNGDIDRIQEYL